LDRDGAKVKALFSKELQTGQFDLSHDPRFELAANRYGFQSGRSTHQNRLDTIRAVFEQHGVMIDTHTADGVKVAAEHLDAGVPMIVLETALPIKFASTIVEALGREPDRPAKFDGIEALPRKVKVMAADVEQVKAYIHAHTTG
jgi:threonine synthase